MSKKRQAETAAALANVKWTTISVSRKSEIIRLVRKMIERIEQ